MRTATDRTRHVAGSALALLAAGLLAACSSSSGGTTSDAGGATQGVTSGTGDAYGYGGAKVGGSTSPGSTSAAASGTDLGTGSTSLGTVVVDGNGMTVYFFDEDTKGSGHSACTGGCAAAWPEVHASSTMPTVTGVTGEVGTITGVDGKRQVTLDGRPLYTYVGDAKPGDASGQGFGGIWWVVSPSGTRIGTQIGK